MESVSCSVTDKHGKAPSVPWKEMFVSGSFRLPKSDPFSVTDTTDDLSPTGPLVVLEAHTPEVQLKTTSLYISIHASSLNFSDLISLFFTAEFGSFVSFMYFLYGSTDYVT